MLSPVSNSQSFIELMKKEMEQVLAKNTDHKCFGPIYRYLIQCYENPHQYIMYLIMIQQPDNCGE